MEAQCISQTGTAVAVRRSNSRSLTVHSYISQLAMKSLVALITKDLAQMPETADQVAFLQRFYPLRTDIPANEIRQTE